MAFPKLSYPTTARPERFNEPKTQENDLKINIMKLIEVKEKTNKNTFST